VSTDQLRILGNEAYRENRNEDAIRYYSEAITASPKETIDTRFADAKPAASISSGIIFLFFKFAIA
jgi:hypothetical protein